MVKFLTDIKNIKIVNNFVLLLMIALVLICLLKVVYIRIFSKDDLKSGSHYSNLYYKIFFAVVFFIAIITRLWSFGNAPGGFFCDEAMSAIDAKAIADYGTDHYGMKFPVYFQAWKNGQQSIMMGYLMAPIIKLFGMSKVTVRLPMLIVSIVAAVCLVLWVKDMFGKKTAAIAAVIVAVNPWHFLEGRWALDCYMFPHFFVISLYLMYKGLKGERNNKSLYLSMVFFGFTMYCYGISIYTIPLFLVIFAIYAVIKKCISIKEIIICAFIYLLVAWPYILCVMVNFFKWNTIATPFFTIPRFYETQRQSDILFFAAEPLKQLKLNIKEFYNLLILQNPDSATPAHAIMGFGTLYICTLPLAVLGIVKLFIIKNKAVERAIIFTALVMGIFGSMITQPYTWRIAILIYPIIVLSALGVEFIAEKIRYSEWVVIASYTLIFTMFVTTYFTTYTKTMEHWFFKGFCDAIEKIETYDADKYYITSNSRSNNTKKESEAWTMFFHDIDAHYYQGLTNENNGKTYLPYKQRYTYGGLTPEKINPGENTVYLVDAAEKKYFSPEKYNFEEYPGVQTVYYVVTPK